VQKGKVLHGCLTSSECFWFYFKYTTQTVLKRMISKVTNPFLHDEHYKDGANPNGLMDDREAFYIS